MLKLKNVYVTWDDKNVHVIPKSKGKPKDGNYFDANDWDCSDLQTLFFDWFLSLSVGLWEIPPHDADHVNAALSDIEEYEACEGDRCSLTTKKLDAPWMHARDPVAKLEALPPDMRDIAAKMEIGRRAGDPSNGVLMDKLDEWDTATYLAAITDIAITIRQWLSNCVGRDSEFEKWLVKDVIGHRDHCGEPLARIVFEPGSELEKFMKAEIEERKAA